MVVVEMMRSLRVAKQNMIVFFGWLSLVGFHTEDFGIIFAICFSTMREIKPLVSRARLFGVVVGLVLHNRG